MQNIQKAIEELQQAKLKAYQVPVKGSTKVAGELCMETITPYVSPKMLNMKIVEEENYGDKVIFTQNFSGVVFKPADIIETIECWQVVLDMPEVHSVMMLSGEELDPVRMDKPIQANRSRSGAYILRYTPNPKGIFVASGTPQVQIAVEAYEILNEQGVSTRVVSVPCERLMEQEDKDFIREVLSPELEARVFVNAKMDVQKVFLQVLMV